MFVLGNLSCYFAFSPHPLLPPHPSTADVIAAATEILVAFRFCHLHNKAVMELYHF